MTVEKQEQGERDRRLLSDLIGDACNLSETECGAFEAMLDTLEAGRFPALTPRQRKWANDVAERLHVEPSVGPEEEGLRDNRFTGGAVPRGRPVLTLIKGFAKAPPGGRKP